MSNATCPCSGANLDKLVHPALLTVLCAGPLHGYKLMEQIAALPGFENGPPDSTYVYRLLRNMERDGYVTGSWNLSARGPAKRLYRITLAGRRCLKNWVDVLTRYRVTIDRLASSADRAVSAASKRSGTRR